MISGLGIFFVLDAKADPRFLNYFVVYLLFV